MSKKHSHNIVLPPAVLEIYGYPCHNRPIFFDTFEEADSFKNTLNCDLITIYYAKNFCDQDDIFIFVNNFGHINIYTALDCDKFATYNQENCEWHEEIGSIRFLYDAFRNRGINFVDDIYPKYDKESAHVYKLNIQDK